MMETTGVCGLEVTRGLVEGSSSPPATTKDDLEEFEGLFKTCCSDEARGETPGREDCQIHHLDGELDPNSDQNKDQKTFGELQFLYCCGTQLFHRVRREL